MKSVDRAFSVLDCFKPDTPDYTLNELARKLKVSKGTVHRILLTAQKRGIIEQNPETSRYQLGIKVFELGSIVARRMDLRNESLPILKKIAEDTGETSFVVVKDGDEAICIERIEGHNFLRALFLEVGRRMPLHIGAGPKVLLAHMSDADIKNWIKKKKLNAWTKHTVTEPEKLWEDIRNIREKGYALSMEDVTIGAAAIGSPIRKAGGKVVGAVSISGASINFQGERLAYYTNVIKEAGREISRRLGYQATNEQLGQEINMREET